MSTAADPIDAWLWGAGYSEQGRAYYPPPPEPIQDRMECAKCGEPVPMNDHVAYDGLPYHSRCLPSMEDDGK